VVLAAATLIPIGSGGLGLPAAVGAGDPVIAAAGDIACDPADGHFLGGNGNATSSSRRRNSDAAPVTLLVTIIEAMLVGLLLRSKK
jgi:hypothetical protein